MIYGDLQIFDIIIFAGIAVFLVFRLRNVLGKRTGFEKNPSNNVGAKPTKTKEAPANNIPELEEKISKLTPLTKIAKPSTWPARPGRTGAW